MYLIKRLYSYVINMSSTQQQRILNSSPSCSPLSLPVEEVGVNLQRCMLTLKGQYLAEDGRGVDYNKIRISEEFKDYCTIADTLSSVNLLQCNEEERKAFFINVYNALTIHGLVTCEQLPESVLELNSFWSNSCYNIGGHVFSLDDIEHGILRCNRPHPSNHGNSSTFPEDDPRCRYVMSVLDPRIHFALVCGAKSCPAIQVYTSNKLERGLTSATQNFIRQEVKIDIDKKTVILSKIFMWYMRDFADSAVPGLLEWIVKYCDDDNPLKEQIESLLSHTPSNNITVQYSEYNWLLNKL